MNVRVEARGLALALRAFAHRWLRPLWAVPYGIHRRWVTRLGPMATARDLLAQSPTSSAQVREWLARVCCEVHPRDGMHAGVPGHYLACGLEAVLLIDRRVRGRPTPSRILDLPSGYGRVLRFLKAAYPTAEVTACDLDRGAVEFCGRVLGARPVRSTLDLTVPELVGPYDLVWCGSLATHLSSGGIEALAELVRRVVAPGGLLLITTHGATAAARMEAAPFRYGMTRTGVEATLRDYRSTGFGHRDYPLVANYGISVCRPEWLVGRVATRGGLVLESVVEAGWDGHQDVLTFRRELDAGTF